MENKKLRPFVRCVIQNFPFIEQDFDALTEYGLISKIVEYLNKVINSQNMVIDLSADLTEAFNQLKEYVDHYFDNLDVQEEINNKLDEMAEAGTLADIIAAYIQLQGVLAYDTVADMKSATNLVNGSFAETYGFYAKGDGGGAKYKIRNITNDDTVDEMFLIEISSDPQNLLVAELIVDSEINAKQVGIMGDGETDVTTKLDTLLNHGAPVYMPSGTYLLSETITITSTNLNLRGDGEKTKIELYDDEAPFYPLIDFSGCTSLYIDGLTTNTSSFKVLTGGGDYVQQMRDKNYYIRNLKCHTSNPAILAYKTNWELFICNGSPASYGSDSALTGNFGNYPLEIVNHSGYNALMISNIATDAEGNNLNAIDHSAIGIYDNVQGSAPTFLIDQKVTRKVARVDNRATDAKYKQGNTVFELHSTGAMALGCKVDPDTTFTGYATLKMHSQYPSILVYNDDGTTIRNSIIAFNYDATKGMNYTRINPGSLGVNTDISDHGLIPPRLSYAYITAWAKDSLTEGAIVYDTTNHRHLFYNGTAWTTGDGTVVYTPTNPEP